MLCALAVVVVGLFLRKGGHRAAAPVLVCGLVLLVGLALWRTLAPGGDARDMVRSAHSDGRAVGWRLAQWAKESRPTARVCILNVPEKPRSVAREVMEGFRQGAREVGLAIAGESVIEMPADLQRRIEAAMADRTPEERAALMAAEKDSLASWVSWEILAEQAAALEGRADMVLCLFSPPDPAPAGGLVAPHRGPPLMLADPLDASGRILPPLFARGLVAAAAVRRADGTDPARPRSGDPREIFDATFRLVTPENVGELAGGTNGP
jgi:hypothetical protein